MKIYHRVRQEKLFYLLVALGILIRLYFFSVSVSVLQPSSDESVAVLQAIDILHGRFPLLFMAQPYMFPVESYLTAVFVAWLPHNAFGARIIPLLIELAGVFVSLAIARRIFTGRSMWLVSLMVVFPFSYVMIMESAYSLPGYSCLSLFGAWGIYFALRQREKEGIVFSFLAGVFTVLAFSNSMLAVPFVLLTALYACFGTSLKSSLISSFSFVTGGVFGALPLVIAKHVMPDSYSAVSIRYKVVEAVHRLWTPTMEKTLPTVTGARICIIPDGDVIHFIKWPLSAWGIICFAIIVSMALVRLYALRRVIKDKWLILEPADIFIGIALCALVSYSLSKRADSHSYRYLIILVWAFPFIIAYLHEISGRFMRYVFSSLMVFLVINNIISTFFLVEEWKKPGFPEKAAIVDIYPVINRLNELGIKHVVASYGAAYRLRYLSDGKILAAQPSNERFPGWPVPYKSDIDKAENVAYVLTDSIRFLRPDIFDRHLKTMNVECKKESVGRFFIYYDFNRKDDDSESVFIPWNKFVSTASHKPERAFYMNDGSAITDWNTDCLQENGMWIRLDLAGPAVINGVVMDYGVRFREMPRVMDVDVLTEDGWVTVVKNEGDILDKFSFLNGHPVYDHTNYQTVSFPSVKVTAVRVTIVKAREAAYWHMGEIRLKGRFCE